MTERNVQEARKRAASYPYQDGMIEIGQGAVYTALGILIWVANILINGGLGKWWIALGVIIFSLFAAVVFVTLVIRYKEKVTFPRSGQVTYERTTREELRDSAMLILLALAIAAATIFIDAWYTSIAVSVGATISLILLFSGIRARLTRMKVLAFFPLTIALVAAYLGVDTTIASGLAIGGSGMVTLFAGVLAMRRYLAANPVPPDEEV
jgi:hypothetical protein